MLAVEERWCRRMSLLRVLIVGMSVGIGCSNALPRRVMQSCPVRFDVTQSKYLGAPLVRMRPLGSLACCDIFLPTEDPSGSIVVERLGEAGTSGTASCHPVSGSSREGGRFRYKLDEGMMFPEWGAVKKPVAEYRFMVPAGWYQVRIRFSIDGRGGQLWESVTSPFYLEKDAEFMTSD